MAERTCAPKVGRSVPCPAPTPRRSELQYGGGSLRQGLVGLPAWRSAGCVARGEGGEGGGERGAEDGHYTPHPPPPPSPSTPLGARCVRSQQVVHD